MSSEGQPTRSEALFNNGAAYEAYVGRWSRQLAPDFLRWVHASPSAHWLDVGCGTGVLTEAILRDESPASVFGVDLSAAHIDYARGHIRDTRAQFEVADAQNLPVENGRYDVTVSGLVINFVPDPDQAMTEMVRATKPGGAIAVYVWDYAGGMPMIDVFWEAASALHADAPGAETGRRYVITQPEPLAALFERTGLQQVETRSIELPMLFASFDDFWTPYLGGQGSGPKYLMSLDEPQRDELREAVRARVPMKTDGSIQMTARVWAARGQRP